MADEDDRTETLRLHRGRGLLFDRDGRCFDPAARAWREAVAGDGGPAVEGAETLSAEAAVAWLQRQSPHPLRVAVGVVGPREASAGQDVAAEALGRGLARMALAVLCGGREGVTAAVCGGGGAEGGLSLGLLPDDTWEAANPHVGLVLATGPGACNAVIARAAFCLVALGGGYGTLSEMAFALQFGRPVFALSDAPEVAEARRLPSVEAALRAVAGRVLARP